MKLSESIRTAIELLVKTHTPLIRHNDEMKNYLDMGYSTVKMKIGGVSLKEDIKRIESVIKLVGKGENLCVDANGRFDLKTAMNYVQDSRLLHIQYNYNV